MNICLTADQSRVGGAEEPNATRDGAKNINAAKQKEGGEATSTRQIVGAAVNKISLCIRRLHVQCMCDHRLVVRGDSMCIPWIFSLRWTSG